MYDDNNWLRYDVYDNCSGTGTRIAGKELRNDVINTMRRTNSPIILDFINVQACSSSFIDEFVSKLILEIGFIMQRILLVQRDLILNFYILGEQIRKN